MPEPRRIAFCITDLDPGGAERALVQIVTRLPRTEWSSKVFCLSGPGDMVGYLEMAGIPVECLGAASPWSWSVIGRLQRGLVEWGPDLLQTFLYHANLAGRWAAHRANVPIVVCGLRVAERDARWRMRFDRWTQRYVTHNVAVSQGVADFAIQECGLNAAKVSVIPNGVDFERFAEAAPADLTQFGIPRSARVITFVGRLHPQKAPEVLLWGAQPRLLSDSGVHLLYVGDGPQRSLLESAARRSGVAERVHFAGRQSDVAGILKESTVCVLPSRWEGMPNVVLEAMASGCPVVATSVEGCRELIQPELTGWLFLPDSTAGLTACLNEVLDQPRAATAIATQAQLISQKRFAWGPIAEKYAELYRELLSRQATIGNSAASDVVIVDN